MGTKRVPYWGSLFRTPFRESGNGGGGWVMRGRGRGLSHNSYNPNNNNELQDDEKLERQAGRSFKPLNCIGLQKIPSHEAEIPCPQAGNPPQQAAPSSCGPETPAPKPPRGVARRIKEELYLDILWYSERKLESS